MLIRVAVVSGDESMLGYLEQESAFRENKMEILSSCASGEELLLIFGEMDPDLVIIDQKQTGLDAQTCILRIQEIKSQCRILVIGGEKDDAEFMRRLFAMKIQGYLSRPIERQELMRELQIASAVIRRATGDIIDSDTNIAMQSLYFWKMMFEKNDMSTDMAFINRTLGCRFKEGYFRVVLLRIDHFKGEIPDFGKVDYYDELHDIQRYIKIALSDHLYEYCYEILCDFRFNGVLTFLNYDARMDPLILDQFDQLRDDVYKFSVLNYGMTVTVCIGRAYEHFSDVALSREEAYQAAWSRMKLGTGRVICYNSNHNAQELYQERVRSLMEELNLTAETLDVEQFDNTVEELFNLPDYVLADYRYKEAIFAFVDRFFEINAAALSKHIGVEQEKELLRKTLNFSHTPQSCREHLQGTLDRLFGLLREDSQKQNLRQLRKAVKYIKDNYSQPITLELLADMVHLNPVYFSHLFKKSIGVRLTDYIAEYRIEMAKKMLFETDMTIYEIASAVGFQDQRYFSKRFRQLVGMTPTEYRKMK